MAARRLLGMMIAALISCAAIFPAGA